MNDKPDIKIVNSGTDASRAADFKTRIIAAYGPICDLMNEIKSAGFEANVQVGIGPLGTVQIVNIVIAKHY